MPKPNHNTDFPEELEAIEILEAQENYQHENIEAYLL